MKRSVSCDVNLFHPELITVVHVLYFQVDIFNRFHAPIDDHVPLRLWPPAEDKAGTDKTDQTAKENDKKTLDVDKNSRPGYLSINIPLK